MRPLQELELFTRHWLQRSHPDGRDDFHGQFFIFMTEMAVPCVVAVFLHFHMLVSGQADG